MAQDPARLGTVLNRVVKSHVSKLDGPAAGRRRQRSRRSFQRCDRRSGVEDLPNPRHRRTTSLEEVNHPSESYQRPGHQAEVKAEGDERTDRDDAAHDQRSPKCNHHDGTQTSQQGEERMHRCVESHEGHVAVQILVAQLAETLDLGCFLAVRTNNSSAGQVFLRLSCQRGKVFLDSVEPLVDCPAESLGDYRQGDHRQQCDNGEHRIDAQHEQQCEDSAAHGVHQIHDRRTRGHSHRAKIIGEASHDVTRSHSRVELGVEGLEVLEEAGAKVEFDATAHAVHQVSHPITHGAGNHCASDDSRGDKPYADQRHLASHRVDADAEQPWDHTAERGRNHDKRKADRELTPVRPEVGKKASELFHKWHTDCPLKRV